MRGPVNQQGFVLRAFPLLTSVEQPVGVVALVDSQAVDSPAAQHERDLELQSYLTQAASALHDLTVYSEREEARRELADTLRDITKTLSRTLEPEEVMNAVLKQMARVLPFDTASIQWPEATGLRIIAGYGFEKPGIDQIVFPYSDEFPNVLVWKTGKSLRYRDVQQEFAHFKDTQYQVERVHGWLGVPLLEGEKTVGVLTLDSFAMDRYGPEHEQVATIFASIAAVALGNALLYDQQRRRARDLETLTEVAEEFSANVPGSAPILDLLVRSACRITGCNCAVVYPFLPGQMVYDTDHIAAFGLLQPKMFSPGQKLRSEDTSLAASVVAQGQRIVCDVYTDCDAERLTSAPFIEREKVRAFVGISLQASKETLGVLFANYWQPQNFDDDDLDTIHRFANLAAFAILNARLYQRIQDDLQKRIKRMNTLREIDDAISSTLDLERTLSLILDRTLEHIQAPYGTIQLVSSDGSVLELVTYRGATLASSGAGLARGEGVTGRAWANTKTYYVPDVHAPEWADIYTTYIPGMDSELAVPMIFEGQVVGVINIEKPKVNSFSEDDIVFVESLAQQAAIAIRNAISYDELKKAKTHLVAAEAVAWLGLLGADWQHTIHQKTFSIDNYTSGLRQGLANYSLPSEAVSLIDTALEGIEGVVDKIRNVEFTSKVPAGPIDRRGAATLVDEKLPQMIARWCAGRPNIVVDSSLNCSGVSVAIPGKWLEVAMEKLVHNALKAMPSGGQLTYRTYCSNDKVSITVKDSGRGIPDDVRHIFLKEIVKRQTGEGTGMGALIARFIALVYGGDLLLVDSHPERGTELRMILPIVHPAVQPGD